MSEIFSRRSFLSAGTGMIVGGALAYWLQSTPARAANDLPVGLQLYSVRKECEKDFSGTLKKVADMGYQGVEFAGFYDIPAKKMRSLLDELGLQCCGSHTQLTALEGDEFEKTVQYNKIIGNKYLIIPSLPEEKRQTIEDWKKMAELFNGLAKKLEPHGMVVGYHNHDFEFKPIEGHEPWDILFSNTDKSVVMQIDTGNCMKGGGDPLAILKKFPGRATTVHFKAYSESNPKALIGEDEVPWKEVLKVCRTSAGTEWIIIEEEKDVVPPLKGVEICLKNLKKIMA
jgi:sugar phosphate isomerase/epimerase